MKSWSAIIFGLAVACGGDGTLPESVDGCVCAPDATVPDAAPPGALIGSFELTYYWVTSQDEFSGANDTTIFADTGICSPIATVPLAFAQSLALEGTGRLSGGVLLNVDGSCACDFSPCFIELGGNFPWGVGAQNNALEPFRSIAVDTDVLSLGTSYYIEELDGLLMPGDPSYGAFHHDGCVRADDVGGGINGQHIDFFAALRAHYLTLDAELGASSVTLHEGGARCP